MITKSITTHAIPRMAAIIIPAADVIAKQFKTPGIVSVVNSSVIGKSILSSFPFMLILFY